MAVAIALVVTAVFDFAADSQTAASYLDVGTLGAIAIFAWRPPVAAVALLLGGGLGLVLGVGGPFVLALALTCGLVIYSCSGWVSSLYLAMAVPMAVGAEVLDQGVAASGLLAVGLVSGTAGWVLRRGHLREQRLNADVSRLTREAAEVIKAERERIADELHDIIAHDITIVLMHTRALSLIEDRVERERSLHAISDAASQAMTDIRRMLHIVQGGGWHTDGAVIESETIQQRIRSISEQFRSAGVPVNLILPEVLTVSNSIKATLWHIANECATNIMKHAPNSPSVNLLLSSSSTVTLRIWNATDTDVQSSATQPSSYGLRRMSERVQLLGGTFTAGPEAGGWQVEAVLPHT